MNKRKWWMLLLAVVIVSVGAVALLWPSLKIYLAPKTVLTSALTNTYQALEMRMANNPLVPVSRGLDFENGNTIDMELNTSNNLLGDICYDMDVQIQWAPRRLLAQGQATAQGNGIDLSVYLDGDFAALTSASLLQGNFYGLTYDTFSQDIRENKLLSLVLNHATLSEWEENIEELEAFMEGSFRFPEVTQSDLRSILVGILTLKAEVEQERIEGNGNYFVISFETTGAQILSGLKYLKTEIPIVLDPNDDVEIAFWLQEDRVVKIEAESDDIELDLYLGMSDTVTDDLTLQYVDKDQALKVTLSTQQDASYYQESITVSGTENFQLSYRWDLNTRDLTLYRNQEGEERSASVNLSETEAGLRLETSDFEGLMHLLCGWEDNADSACAILLRKGAEFETPMYKNFDQWSMNDLAALLGSVGGLFGLKIA